MKTINKNKALKVVVFFLMAISILVWKPIFNKNSSGQSNQKRQGKSEIALDLDNLKGMISTKAHANKVSQYDQWARNPFYVDKEPISSETSPFEINGIFWSEDNPSTLIGEDVYTVGDKFGDYVITNIQPQFIVISNGRKVIKLELKDNLEEALNQ